MSSDVHDMVRFKVPLDRLVSYSRGKEYRLLLQTVFKIRPEEIGAAPRDDLTIECRPSQFARFLILRNEMGFANGFKELYPELIAGVKSKDYKINVTDRSGYVHLDAFRRAHVGGDDS